MAFFRGPHIVTDGLVLCLDSMSPRSYPGSGNTWYDLTKYKNNGTLVNFSGPGSGSTSGFDTNTNLMMFDRHVGGDSSANNYVSFNNSDTLQNSLSQSGVSIELWAKVTNLECTAITKLTGAWEIYYCNILTHRTQGTGGSDGSSTINSSTYFSKMHHILATHDGTNRRMYVNGYRVLNDVNSISGQSFTSLSLGAYYGGNYAFFGAISVYRIYNKALTSGEVTQNFNAIKSRFNL